MSTKRLSRDVHQTNSDTLDNTNSMQYYFTNITLSYENYSTFDLS